MIEIYFKYDNMYTFGIINAFNCINNHVNLCINSMLSVFTRARTHVCVINEKAPFSRFLLSH